MAELNKQPQTQQHIKTQIQFENKVQKVDPKQYKITGESVKLVTQQTQCQGNIAYEMLIKHKGDLVSAILQIIADESLIKYHKRNDQDDQIQKGCLNWCFE